MAGTCEGRGVEQTSVRTALVIGYGAPTTHRRGVQAERRKAEILLQTAEISCIIVFRAARRDGKGSCRENCEQDEQREFSQIQNTRSPIHPPPTGIGEEHVGWNVDTLRQKLRKNSKARACRRELHVHVDRLLPVYPTYKYGVKMLSAKKLSAASTSAWVNEGFSG